MRIGLFIPCYIDAFFPEVGAATLKLFEPFGHEVVYPRDQTCYRLYQQGCAERTGVPIKLIHIARSLNGAAE